jgi:hypothetical protein
MATTSNSVVTASLVVNFDSGGSDGILSAEVDDRSDGLNLGNTNFAPGDRVGILMFKTTNVVMDPGTPVITGGTIAGAGSGTLVVEEDITFAKEKEANSKYPINSVSSYIWMGTSGGTLSKKNETTFSIPAEAIAIARVRYVTNWTGYYLQSPVTLSGLSSFSILVFFSGYIPLT